jgi:transposase
VDGLSESSREGAIATLDNRLVGSLLDERKGTIASRKIVHAENQRGITAEVRSGLGNRQIARSCGVNHSTVADYLRRAKTAGLASWPLPAELDETSLEVRLFPLGITRSNRPRSAPDWPAIHEELHGHKHLTLQLLWEEYKQAEPGGYQYSRFCERYQRWKSKLDLVLRQEHRAGEKLFVDYAGQTVPVTNPKTGEVTQASIFVAVLGASNYTYADASWKQDLACWIRSHVRALEFLGASPAVLVPDNLKTGVRHPCRYEPDLNPTYQEMAAHYGIAVIDRLARIDVLIVDDWAMAPLADSERRDFLEICDDRYAARSTILTSQIPLAHWHEQIGDPTVADSILDRLVHNAHRIELQGPSIRKNKTVKPDSNGKA